MQQAAYRGTLTVTHVRSVDDLVIADDLPAGFRVENPGSPGTRKVVVGGTRQIRASAERP
jgi:uncharacterized protein YfaS (alpha-2-macroglobulin family)